MHEAAELAQSRVRMEHGNRPIGDRPPSSTLVPGALPLDRLVGRSVAMTAVREKLRRVARSDASVLVQGGSGTGKEMAARVIHDLSPRSRGPFVPVDCGAFAEGVLESELFGHARGAFTHATHDRRGLFEEAHGGTLFLDEIGNTTPSLQARLLRVLQEREVRRVGCNRARPIDVRIVAAANRDLATDVAGGRFREDLLYRLDVLEVRLPLLRERREDIPLLAHHVLAEINERTGMEHRLSARALAALIGYPWPGNVRELRNVLERATTFAATGVIELEHLPDAVAGRVACTGEQPPLNELVDDFERSLLLDRLRANAWNRTRTARELGITRRCLFNKTRKHHLEP